MGGFGAYLGKGGCGRREQYDNIGICNRMSSVLPALKVCYLEDDTAGQVYCSFTVVKSQ